MRVLKKISSYSSTFDALAEIVIYINMNMIIYFRSHIGLIIGSFILLRIVDVLRI